MISNISEMVQDRDIVKVED